MTIIIPTYQIHCDECHNVMTFPLAATQFPNVFELRAIDDIYIHFGGEILPDGKHRCAACATSSIDTSPAAISTRIDRIRNTPSAVEPFYRILEIVRDYFNYNEEVQNMLGLQIVQQLIVALKQSGMR